MDVNLEGYYCKAFHRPKRGQAKRDSGGIIVYINNLWLRVFSSLKNTKIILFGYNYVKAILGLIKMFL